MGKVSVEKAAACVKGEESGNPALSYLCVKHLLTDIWKVIALAASGEENFEAGEEIVPSILSLLIEI